MACVKAPCLCSACFRVGQWRRLCLSVPWGSDAPGQAAGTRRFHCPRPWGDGAPKTRANPALACALGWLKILGRSVWWALHSPAAPSNSQHTWGTDGQGPGSPHRASTYCSPASSLSPCPRCWEGTLTAPGPSAGPSAFPQCSLLTALLAGPRPTPPLWSHTCSRYHSPEGTGLCRASASEQKPQRELSSRRPGSQSGCHLRTERWGTLGRKLAEPQDLRGHGRGPGGWPGGPAEAKALAGGGEVAGWLGASTGGNWHWTHGASCRDAVVRGVSGEWNPNAGAQETGGLDPWV